MNAEMLRKFKERYEKTYRFVTASYGGRYVPIAADFKLLLDEVLRLRHRAGECECPKIELLISREYCGTWKPSGADVLREVD